MTFLLGDLLQVLENAALEVIDLFEALAQHVTRGFFATDATGAEHGDLLVHCRVEMRLDVLRKLSKRRGLRIDGAFEGADRDFVIVASIDQQHFGIADQVVPVLGLDVSTDALVRVDAFDTQGHDLFLELDLGAIERLLVAVGFLVVDIDQARVVLQPRHQAIDAFASAGHCAVDALVGNQQCALDTVVDHRLQQRLAQLHVIAEGDELVQRGHDDRLSHRLLSHVFLQWRPSQRAYRVKNCGPKKRTGQAARCGF